MTRPYDMVVFGASGFTGQFVVEEIAKLLKDKKVEPFRWAVAGRSKSKLLQVLKQASEATGYNVYDIDILEVDIDVPDTIHEMAKQTTVVANCVGPYRFFGEVVVKACIAEGTNHIDVSGEPQFLEQIQLLYNKEAEKKGVYVIGACGFDSIPADMGVAHLKKKFDGKINSVETYVSVDPEPHQTAGGASIHYGTWQSAIHGVSSFKELGPLRRKLYPQVLPKPKFKLPPRSVIHYNDILKGWCLPFPFADKSIVSRSERYFYEETKERPVQIKTYIKIGTFVQALLMLIGGILFGVIAQFKFGRYLLEKYPAIFSAGTVSHEGPSRETANTPFSVTIIAEGWKEKLAEPTDEYSEKPNKKMILKVRGINPGYGATCLMMVQAGLTIIREQHLMPQKGGVYTTGAAFSNTTLVERLHNTGLTFTIEK